MRNFRLVLLLAALLPACSESSSPGADGPPSGKPVVYTVNYPLAYFAERLGGDAYEIVFPVAPDEDPAFWKPTDDDIAAFQSADLILLNGATYAKWRENVSLPESKLVDTSKEFRKRYIDTSVQPSHSHGKDGIHAHSGTAFTTWIDFGLARLQAKAVRNALGKLQPAAATRVNTAWKELEADLKKLDEDMSELAFAIGDKPLLASHPVYQYFARAYQLDIESLLWEPETVPDSAALADLKTLREQRPSAYMIWEGAPNDDSIEILGSLGVMSLVFDPCGNRPDEGQDWLSVMRANLENLKGLLPQQGDRSPGPNAAKEDRG